MKLSAESVESALSTLPSHYQSVFKYIYGDGPQRQILLEEALKNLEFLNVSVVASKSVYRSGDYDTDSKFQEYIFDVLKKGSKESTVLDTPRSVLKAEIVSAFKVPTFLKSCIDFHLDTSDKVADALLGVSKVAPLTKVILRNMFVQAHVTIILLQLAVALGIKLNSENKQSLKQVNSFFHWHQIKNISKDLWTRFNHILLIVVGFGLVAYGGTQSWDFNTSPSIYIPYNDIYASLLSPKNQLLFKMQLLVVFALMFYLIIGNKFHYLVQLNRKTEPRTQKSVKKIIPAFYIAFLFYLANPINNYLDNNSAIKHPIQSAVERKDYTQAEKLISEQNTWSTEYKYYALAQLTIQKRYEMPIDEYKAQLGKYSSYIVKEYEKGRVSSDYAESYAVKKILDANGVSNDLRSHDTHLLVMIIWLLILAYCFISLSIEVDYLGIKKYRQKKLEAKIKVTDDQINA